MPVYAPFSFTPQEMTDGRYNPAHGAVIVSVYSVVQGITFDRATCDPAQGVLAQGNLGFYLTCAYISYRRLCLSLHCGLKTRLEDTRTLK